MLILCVPVLHQYQSIEKINHLETDEKNTSIAMHWSVEGWKVADALLDLESERGILTPLKK